MLGRAISSVPPPPSRNSRKLLRVVVPSSLCAPAECLQYTPPCSLRQAGVQWGSPWCPPAYLRVAVGFSRRAHARTLQPTPAHPQPPAGKLKAVRRPLHGGSQWCTSWSPSPCSTLPKLSDPPHSPPPLPSASPLHQAKRCHRTPSPRSPPCSPAAGAYGGGGGDVDGGAGVEDPPLLHHPHGG